MTHGDESHPDTSIVEALKSGCAVLSEQAWNGMPWSA
jgi:hypothetical protein